MSKKQGAFHRENSLPWLWFLGAVAVYCCVILLMIPEKKAEEPMPIPETVPVTTEPALETQQTEPVVEEIPPSWNLLLVNPWNYIPQDFTVELAELEEGQAVDQRVALHLETMMEAMEAEGLSPLVCSSYRTQEKQEYLYDRKVTQYRNQGYSQQGAEEAAGRWIAVPGTSEHQTGLAVDIIDTHYPYLDQKQEDTAVQKWLMVNSWQYGFILRYPSDKTEMTGINYEPWHYRYVGKEAAREIFEQDICLEEYLAVG